MLTNKLDCCFVWKKTRSRQTNYRTFVCISPCWHTMPPAWWVFPYSPPRLFHVGGTTGLNVLFSNNVSLIWEFIAHLVWFGAIEVGLHHWNPGSKWFLSAISNNFVLEYLLRRSFHTTSAFPPLPGMLEGQFTRISLHRLLLHQVADEVFGCARFKKRRKRSSCRESTLTCQLLLCCVIQSSYLNPRCRPSTASRIHTPPWESAQITWRRSRRRTEDIRTIWRAIGAGFRGRRRSFYIQRR